MIRLLLGLIVLSTAFAEPLQAAEKQKNVLLFVIDDQEFQAGCYGNQMIETPGIDRLAATGTRFSRAHCTTASGSAKTTSSPSFFTSAAATRTVAAVREVSPITTTSPASIPA